MATPGILHSIWKGISLWLIEKSSINPIGLSSSRKVDFSPHKVKRIIFAVKLSKNTPKPIAMNLLP